MDRATHERIMSELGLGTDEDRMVAQMQMPGLTIAILTVLREKGLIDDAEVERIHELAQTTAERLADFTLSAFKLGLASEGQLKMNLEKAKAYARKVLEAGRWLLDDSLALKCAKREELGEMLAQVSQALEDEEKTDGGTS